MIDAPLPIDDGIYQSELRNKLWSIKFDNKFDRDLIALLIKLLKLDLGTMFLDDLKVLFSQQEIDLLKKVGPDSITENKEIIARWYDVLSLFDNKLLFSKIHLISFHYWQIYLDTNDYEYLLRHLTTIRSCKPAFKNDLEVVFENCKPLILNIESAFWQLQLLTEAPAVFTLTKCQEAFGEILIAQKEKYIKNHDHSSARCIVESLFAIQIISKNEKRIMLAETYEAQADFYVKTKQPNTFYPNISQTYRKGLKEIKSVANCDDLRKRLEDKIRPEMKEDFRLIQTAGVKVSPTVDIELLWNNVNQLGIDSFESAYQTLVSLPIPTNDKILKEFEKSKENEMPLAKYFSKQVKINEKGAQISAAENDEALLSNVRGFYREVNIAYISLVKEKLDIFGEVNKRFVSKLLEESKSTFIPKDRLYIFALGIYEGFDNNFITAAHLLVPQLENSFRHIAELHGITVTNFEKELQLENILGGVLEKMKNITNNDLYEELKSFLNDSNSVNFRNQLSHGLMNSVLLHHYGQYAWWLTLKMILFSKNLFSVPEPK